MHYTSKPQLQNYLKGHSFTAVMVVVDEKMRHYHPDYFSCFDCGKPLFFYEVACGEERKSVCEAEKIWRWLLASGADKNSLIINFGGGMVSDLGGFVASTYKRGIPFINIPTTLLAMIDAAIGGKNGLNMGEVKNSVGTIYFPDEVFTDLAFLETLPHEEFLSGFGELIKYALIGNAQLWRELQNLSDLNSQTLRPEWIEQAASFKKRIVEQDPYDQDLRKILNFGHTVGHAIEALLLLQKRPITHGHAVALGLYFESWVSCQYGKLSEEEALSIKKLVMRFFTLPTFSEVDFQQLGEFVKADKKSFSEKIVIPLLDGLGEVSLHDEVLLNDIVNGIRFLI